MPICNFWHAHLQLLACPSAPSAPDLAMAGRSIPLPLARADMGMSNAAAAI